MAICHYVPKVSLLHFFLSSHSGTSTKCKVGLVIVTLCLFYIFLPFFLFLDELWIFFLVINSVLSCIYLPLKVYIEFLFHSLRLMFLQYLLSSFPKLLQHCLEFPVHILQLGFHFYCKYGAPINFNSSNFCGLVCAVDLLIHIILTYVIFSCICVWSRHWFL